MEIVDNTQKKNILFDTWNIWIHYCYDNNWNLESYQKLSNIETVEDIIVFFNLISEKIIKNSMIFIMRNNITPLWEDEKNKEGACLSYKIHNKLIFNIFKKVSILLMGETLVDENFRSLINGISISPKKNYVILKIWLNNNNEIKSNIINNSSELNNFQYIFKKHIES